MMDYKSFTELLVKIIEKSDEELLMCYLSVHNEVMISLKNENDSVPLHSLMYYNISKCCNMLKIITFFKESMFSLKNNYGSTPLHMLMSNQFSNCSNKFEILTLFKESMISLKNNNGKTPLNRLMNYQFNKCSDDDKRMIVSLFKDNLSDYTDKIKDYLPISEPVEPIVIRVPRGVVVEYYD